MENMLTNALLTLGGLARVTGVPSARLLRWWDRNTIDSSHFDSTTSGSGQYRGYSRPTINKVAIASKLIPLLGINAGLALTAAAQFTDFGDSTRAANTPFEFGRTVLIHTSTGTTIKNLDADVSLSDAFGRPLAPAIILDIGPVINDIDQKLKEEAKRK
jgi:hypothetical protein